MISSELAGLAPAERADLIYRLARTDLDSRLWEAALGRAAGLATTTELKAAASPLRLEALVEALSTDDRLAPRLAGASSDPTVGRSPDLPGLGANAAYQPLLEQAAKRTGFDPALLAAIIDAEAAKTGGGQWDPVSRNPRSTAAGLGQFLAGTWLGEARRPGSWLFETARSRDWLTPAGAVRPEAREALLALRFDPRASIEAVADHAASNLRRLRAQGVCSDDLPAQARAAYLAHHLGLGDALRFLGRGIDEGRAGRLLAAQVGAAAAGRRIAAAGSAAEAHRDWLLAYVDRRVRPTRFLSA
ncbi:hypothetical protein GCM10022280_04390 [Sphingomonas swuensis]|uniref:Peptidoglycan-binding protein n=1 Tax=Sphingomonas swuensis TaxID=977800 RepID=A0ABP7SDN8_9SPHN